MENGLAEVDIFESIFESTPDGLLVIGSDARITRVNAQAMTMFGYRRVELVGQAIELLIPERLKNRHVSHRSRYMEAPNTRPMGVGLELFGQRKDGSEFAVDIMLSPLNMKTESAVLCVVRDVTERKKAEVERARLAAIFDSATDAIIAMSLDGEILSWNPAAVRVMGYLPGEIVGKNVTHLVPDDSLEDVANVLARVRKGERVEPYVSVRRRKDGVLIEVSLSVSPVMDAQGNVVGASKIVTDITERRHAEQRILESLREKEVLLKEIHHRVKNNLAVISSLFYLQATYTQDVRLKQILQESQDRVRSMALVHESLYGSDNLAVVNFAEYARDLSAQLIRSYCLTPGGIQLIEDLEDVHMSIELAVPCGLILNEIFTNAVKHAFGGVSGGEIRLSLKRGADDTCVMCVVDNGVGLPAGLDAMNSPTMGLRLVRSLTRQIGGNFDLARAAPGTQARLQLKLSPYAQTD